MGYKTRNLSPPIDRDAATFSVAVERGQNAVLFADDEQRFIYANPAASQLLGYSNAELLSMSIWDITPGVDAEAGRILWQAFVDEGHQQGEYRVQRKDGSIRVCEYSASAHVAPGVHMSDLHDVTERIRAADVERARADEKEILVREIQHRVKNVLATVVALIRLQLLSDETKADDDRVARLIGRVEAMAASASSRLEGTSEGSDSSSAKELIRSVATSTCTTTALVMDDVTFDIEGEDCQIAWDGTDPIALILNEVLTNYLQHSTRPGQATHFHFGIAGNRGQLTSLAITFSRPFASAPQTWSEGFGMRIVRLFADQAGATVEWRQGEKTSSFHLSIHRGDE